ncbi:MAG: YibE/F family protein [Acidimicrobiales bacterium]|nr:YibE/F family protein [Acidimicrobiales bacterium]
MGGGHAHSHSHGDGHEPELAPSAARRALLVAAAAVGALTLLGLVLLWPRGEADADLGELGFPAQLVDATVTSVREGPCQGTAPSDGVVCDEIEARITNGPTEGDVAAFELAPGASNPGLAAGDRIVLGYAPDADPGFQYYFADFQRRGPLVALAVIFAVAVVVLGRWQGLRALAGLALSLLVLVAFTLPALLEGDSPLAVALVSASAVAFLALYLAHGVNTRTTTALLGTFLSLALTGLLGLVFVSLARFTGLGDEEAIYLQVSSDQIDLRGLLLAGIVIGSLGVLDDVTVTQVSAVWELRRASPGLGARQLYRSALRIGRDHISSTVNTLVLAYAGASLPLLLLFTQASRPLGEIITGEVVAVEVVRTLVGSIGLVAAVPITTGLAALVLAGRRPASAPGVAEPAEPS